MKSILPNLFLIIALIAGLLLVLQHTNSAALPGCGPQSGCGELANSDWGRVAGWPVSMIGLAYVAALLVASISFRRSGKAPRRPASATVVIVVGALASMFYLAVMLVLGRWCLYCVLFHFGNLGFAVAWLIRLRGGETPAADVSSQSFPSSVSTEGMWWMRWFGAGVVTLLVVGSLDRQHQTKVESETREQVIENTNVVVTDFYNTASTVDANGALTGRHPRGQNPSTSRLVVFQDYQCGSCRELESKLADRLLQQNDLHVSIRQFPLCDDCNPLVRHPRLHPEACRAAYLAEAVALLAGEQSFWKVHEWLHERDGTFGDNELHELSDKLSIDADDLKSVMDSEVVRQQVDADIQLGIALGVGSTPFVFLNGIAINRAATYPEHVELALDHLATTIQKRRKDGQPVIARAADTDPLPPETLERTVSLWMRSDLHKNLPQRESCQHVLGDPDSRQRVILFLDPTSNNAGPMWKMLHELVSLREQQSNHVRVELYLLPFSHLLNLRLTDSDLASPIRSEVATKILKAVQILAGDTAFDQTLGWLASDGKTVETDGLPAAVTEDLAGEQWTLEALTQTVESAAVRDATGSDFQQAADCEIFSAPTLIVGSRVCPVDSLSAQTVNRMLDESSAPFRINQPRARKSFN